MQPAQSVYAERTTQNRAPPVRVCIPGRNGAERRISILPPAEREFPALLGVERKTNPFFFRANARKKKRKKKPQNTNKTPTKHQQNTNKTPTKKISRLRAKKKAVKKTFALTREKYNQFPGVGEMSQIRRNSRSDHQATVVLSPHEALAKNDDKNEWMK